MNQSHSMIHPSPFAKYAAAHATVKAAFDSENCVILRNPDPKIGFQVIDFKLHQLASIGEAGAVELCSRLLAGPVWECCGLAGDKSINVEFLRRFSQHGKPLLALMPVLKYLGVSEARQQQQVEFLIGFLRSLPVGMLASWVQTKLETMQPGEHILFRPSWIKQLPPPEKSKPSLRLVKTTPKDA